MNRWQNKTDMEMSQGSFPPRPSGLHQANMKVDSMFNDIWYAVGVLQVSVLGGSVLLTLLVNEFLVHTVKVGGLR